MSFRGSIASGPGLSARSFPVPHLGLSTAASVGHLRQASLWLRAPLLLLATLAMASAVAPSVQAKMLAQSQAQSQTPASAENALDPAPRDPALVDAAQIDATPRVRLTGNVRPEANSANDLGPVEDNLPLEHVLLQLKRSTAQQVALDAFMAQQNDKSSPNYHHWLTPEEFGARFGLPQQTIAQVTGWLALHGLTVHAVYTNRLMVDFSATAGEIRETFHTQIHNYEVDGVHHIANATDPEIPSALAPVIAGIVSLHDFRPRPQVVSHSRSHPELTVGAGILASYPVTATDLATIYNFTPLFKAGYTGKGQIIAVVEASDVYSAADWTTFRAAFGLSSYTTGSFRQIHPAPAKGADNCTDPRALSGWDEESILDAQYASAAAPGATIELAACASTAATSGNLIALTNLINASSASGTLPSVLSVSYGTCEAANGAAANAAINAAYQQGAAEGISIFAAAGDGGASLCDEGMTVATHGLGVNAYASTPYNVAVGGTDFSDTYSRTTSSYWNKTNVVNGSARSYIPEIPWNDSCASPLIALFNGYKLTYGPLGFCFADYIGLEIYQSLLASSGGPSSCATGSPSAAHVTSGSCQGWAKPTWQSVPGNPADGRRDLPDLALFAADGIWNHSFLFCDSNLMDDDGAPCSANNVDDWSQAGGTSFAAPIMAGIQALVDQKSGRQGNPNPTYYKLATIQFNSTTLKSACNSSLGATSNTACVFHDITLGSSDVNCQGKISCYTDVLSTSSNSYAPTFNATPGWDFASGLGSVNAYNLVMNPAW